MQLIVLGLNHKTAPVEVREGFNFSADRIARILRRLRNEGYFEVTLRESPEGPPRKYYRLTQKGIQTQEELYAEWMEFSQQVNHLIGGIQYDEK